MNTRLEMLHAADAILKENPEPKTPSVRIRYRGQRPALNWLKKQDEKAAAALWRVARQRLPLDAANDNQANAKGLGVDRRKDGKARGKNPDPRSLDAYLAIPGIVPRLGDAEPKPVSLSQWDGESRGITIKCQDWLHPDAVFTDRTAFSFHPCAIAPGAMFLGSIGGLGQPKMGKTRGDVRRVEDGTIAKPPSEIDVVIETTLAGGNLADVGRALGANGGHADRRGRRAVLAAGKWAIKAIAA